MERSALPARGASLASTSYSPPLPSSGLHRLQSTRGCRPTSRAAPHPDYAGLGLRSQPRRSRSGWGSDRSGPLRAADLAAGGAADGEPSSSSSSSSSSSQSVSSPAWLSRLSSPYDKEILGLALPALFSVLMDPLMGMVDTAIVGRLGTEPLAAVGLSTIVYNFSNFIWNFLLYTTTPRIAGALSRGDAKEVSAITAQGLWVGATIGLVMTAVLWVNCPGIFAAMGAKPEVTRFAVPYLRGRCIASPAILMFYVISGTFRGFKDTTTPLLAGVVSNVIHLGLDVAFVFGLGWGVVGAALATSLSHWVTLGILGGMVIAKGHLRLEDLLRVPAWRDVAPMLRSGVLLSTRSILAMSMLMWATKLIAAFGAVSLAAHEVIRIIWVMSNQAFTSLDIATQSLVAFYLGRGDRANAAGVYGRTLRLAVSIGVGVTAALLLNASSLPAVFSRDPAVIVAVAGVLPLIAVLMPLDAAASVMDGVLLGAQESAWLSRTMIMTASCCAVGLLLCQRSGWGILSIWFVIKFLTIGRLFGNSWRLRSRDGPLALPAAAAA